MSKRRRRRKRESTESDRRGRGRARQRSETHGYTDSISDEPVVERKKEPYRPNPISEKLVPATAIATRKFKSTGAECNACGWRTRKSGFNARQAIRAHSKVHANRRRAYHRPLMRQSLLLMVLASGLLVAYFARIEQEVGVITIHEDEIAVAVTISAVSVVIGIALWWSLDTAQSTYSRTAIRSARVINLVATVAVVGFGMLWILGSPRPIWYGLVAPLVLMALTIPSAGEIGLAAHGARNGKWRSSKYSGLVRPKDEDAEFEYAEWRFRLINAFRRRRVDIRQLRGPALLVVQSWLQSRRLAEVKRIRRKQGRRARHQ